MHKEKSCIKLRILEKGQIWRQRLTRDWIHQWGPLESDGLQCSPPVRLGCSTVNTMLGHHCDAKWAFHRKIWSVKGACYSNAVGRLFFLFFFFFIFVFVWESQNPRVFSWRFPVRDSRWKRSIKSVLTKHSSNQSGYGRFSWPCCYWQNCVLPNPKSICWSPKPNDLRRWLYLEIRSSQRYLN